MEKKAYMYGLSAVFLWSTVATAFKYSLMYISPIQLLCIASVVSTFVLFVISFQSGSLKRLKDLKRKDLFFMLGLGCLNPFLYYLVLFEAYNILPAQEAQPLNYTWALTLSYLSALLLKHKLSWQDIVAGLVCYFGVFVISTRGDILGFNFSDPYGVFLALFSTLLWAFYWIYSTKVKIDASLGLLLNFISGTILILILAFFKGELESLHVKGVFGAVYVGVFEMGLTFFLWIKALKSTTQTAKIANLIFLSPFISLVIIWMVLGEKILPSTITGLVLIVIGLLVQRYKKAS